MLRTDRIESKFLFWRGLYYEGSIFPKRERERERERGSDNFRGKWKIV